MGICKLGKREKRENRAYCLDFVFIRFCGVSVNF